MISKDQIRRELLRIADNHNMGGESVELIVNQLTYALYHNQLEITNAIQESNLSTAHLLNSKIRSCMNVMYPVYRGKNARVKLTFTNDTVINKSKFDILFTSNTFKVYAEEPINIKQSTGSGEPYSLIGILCNKDLYDNTIEITVDNKYYVDFKINQSIVEDLSEDIQVFLDGVEYQTTRNFFDYIQQLVDEETKDVLFVLTIPGYGIRLYKRGYFQCQSVRIRAFKYTTVDEINKDEFSKICIPGTILVSYDSETKKSTPTKLNKDIIVKRNLTDIHNQNGVIKEIERDNEKSLLHDANFYSRLQSQIMSKSDINNLFNEYFIDQVSNSINWFMGDSENFGEGVIMIFYVPKVNYDSISPDSVNTFITKYGSYFITSNLMAESGVLLTISVSLTIYTNESKDLSEQINKIFSQYANQLNDPTEFDNPDINILKPKQIFADISKLPQVDYIDSLKYVTCTANNGGMQYPFQQNGLPITYVNLDSIKVPTYYQFNVDIIYKSDNEVIS